MAFTILSYAAYSSGVDCHASPVPELSPSLSSGGQGAAHARSHMNGSMALVKTIEQITETMPLVPKQ